MLALLLKPTGDAAQSCALSLGALALLAISWDSRRFYWRVVLGFPDRYVRILTVVVAFAFLSTSAIVLARLATPGIVVALVLALAMVAIARQRFSEIALVVISFMPLLSGFGLAWLKPPLLSLYTNLDVHEWGSALVEGVSTPFGVGFDGERGFRLYQGTFASTGVSGLATLVLMLVLMLVLCARTYVCLRPSSGEAGGMLAAGGICVFVAVAGLFANPLASPSLAMVLWLFLGMANGTIHAVGRVTAKVPSVAEQTHSNGCAATRSASPTCFPATPRAKAPRPSSTISTPSTARAYSRYCWPWGPVHSSHWPAAWAQRYASSSHPRGHARCVSPRKRRALGGASRASSSFSCSVASICAVGHCDAPRA